MNEQLLAKNICNKLQNHGHEAVFAGGCVRDMLLGLQPHDFDIATSATPQQVTELFDTVIPVGIDFGVVVVVIDGHQFEVATFRSDIGTDGRRPESVEFSSMKQDASLS